MVERSDLNNKDNVVKLHVRHGGVILPLSHNILKME